MTYNNTTTQVLSLFVKALGIPVTHKSIDDELQKHPDYASLLAFSDVLDRFFVPNAAYQLQLEQLIDVPVPFIAHVNKNKFALVTQFNDKQVVFSDERFKSKAITFEEFKKTYSGSVFIAEKNEDSGEVDDWYEQKQKNYEDWANQYPATAQSVNNECFQKQRNWCKLTDVTSTPTLFINGRKLRDLYQTEDIKYFI